MIPFWKKTDKGGKKTPPKPAIPHTAQQSIPMQRMFEAVSYTHLTLPTTSRV